MYSDPRDDKIFEWWHNGDRRWVVADWYEAKQYHLRWFCENCGLVYSRRGRGPGLCPDCLSRAVIRLCEAWDSRGDPWDQGDDPEDIESLRITNF